MILNNLAKKSPWVIAGMLASAFAVATPAGGGMVTCEQYENIGSVRSISGGIGDLPDWIGNDNQVVVSSSGIGDLPSSFSS